MLSPSFVPNFGQGPFPKIAGKSPALCNTNFSPGVSADFFEINFFQKKNLSGTLYASVSNRLGLDQDECSVGPDLGPNSLQRLSGDDKSRH